MNKTRKLLLVKKIEFINEFKNIMKWNNKLKFQADMILGEEVSEERYNEMLEVLPPQAMVANAFLVGEPTDHEGGRARYELYFIRDGKHYSGGLVSEPDFKLWLIPANY